MNKADKIINRDNNIIDDKVEIKMNSFYFSEKMSYFNLRDLYVCMYVYKYLYFIDSNQIIIKIYILMINVIWIWI